MKEKILLFFPLLFISAYGYADNLYSQYGSCKKESQGGDRLWCYDSLYEKNSSDIKSNIIDCRKNNVTSSSRRLYCYDGIMSKGYADTNLMGNWMWDLSYDMNTFSISYPLKNKLVPNPEDADIVKLYVVPVDDHQGLYNNRLVVKCEDRNVQVYLEDKYSKTGYATAPSKVKAMYALFSGDENQYNNWYKYENKFIFNDAESQFTGKSDVIKKILDSDSISIHIVNSGGFYFDSKSDIQSFNFDTKGLREAIKPFKQCFPYSYE